MQNSYYPLNLDVQGKKCLVIGGGAVAERKARTLLEFGAKTAVVAPDLTPGLIKLSKAGRIKTTRRKYQLGDLNKVFLAIAATDDSATNKRIFLDATKAKILVNVIDRPELCSFIAPSFIKRGPLVVSISTSGHAPALSKAIRLKLEKIITPALGKLASELGKIRRKKLGTATLRA